MNRKVMKKMKDDSYFILIIPKTRWWRCIHHYFLFPLCYNSRILQSGMNPVSSHSATSNFCCHMNFILITELTDLLIKNTIWKKWHSISFCTKKYSSNNIPCATFKFATVIWHHYDKLVSGLYKIQTKLLC